MPPISREGGDGSAQRVRSLVFMIPLLWKVFCVAQLLQATLDAVMLLQGGHKVPHHHHNRFMALSPGPPG